MLAMDQLEAGVWVGEGVVARIALEGMRLGIVA